MGEILKKTFSIINKNLWLLFLFMTVSYLGLVYFSMLKGSADSLFKVFWGLITLFLIIIVGIAGFFPTLKATVESEYTTEKDENAEVIKAFPKGVAEYFGTSVGIIFIYFFLFSLMLAITYFIGSKFIGMFSFSLQEFSNALVSVETLTKFVENISFDDFLKLSKWHLLYMSASSVFTFLLLYWMPETFYSTKNPFVSLFRSLKKSVFYSLKTLKLFFAIVLINIFTSIIMSLMLSIPILSVFVYFIYFYSLLYILILTFTYYRANFIPLGKMLDVVSEAEAQEIENIIADDEDANEE